MFAMPTTLGRMIMVWKPYREISDEESRAFDKKFRKKSRFLIDESLGAEAARVLRDLGWNTVFVGDVGLSGRDDKDIYAFAWKEDRILLTHDTDFLDDVRFPPYRNPGVVILPGAAGSPAPLERELARLHIILAPYREAHRYAKILVGTWGEWSISAWGKRDGRHARWRIRFGRHGRVEIWSEE